MGGEGIISNGPDIWQVVQGYMISVAHVECPKINDFECWFSNKAITLVQHDFPITYSYHFHLMPDSAKLSIHL